MPRPLRIVIATALAAFLAAGLVGLADAVVNALVYGWPGGAGSLLAGFTLYGWIGLVAALLVSAPLLMLARGRQGVRAAVPPWTLALVLGAFGAVYLGRAVHEAPVAEWWSDHLGPPWVPVALIGLGLAAGLAVPLRRLSRRLGEPSGGRLLALATIAVAASVLWPDARAENRRRSLGDATPLTAPEGAANVVLLSIDTLRRDKLSCLAPDAPATPHLDGLAATGRCFANAWSVSSWTLPAMATVMTGQPARALGISRTVGLPDAVPTLAERAWRAGWWTAAVVANPYLAADFGFHRGFADFDHSDAIESLSPARRTVLVRELERYLVELVDVGDGDRLMDAAARWLDRHDGRRPFLLWIHMMDPHLPYRSHVEDADLPLHPLLDDDRFTDIAALRASLPDVAPEVRRAVEDLYDGEVRHADACVGRLLDMLERAGHADDTWIVVLSDHGEEFFEHGGYEHGHSLMPEVTGIPLLIRPPGGQTDGVVDTRAVTLLDLAPSLALALGWTFPDPLPGRPSLVPGPDGAPCPPTDLAVLEHVLYGPPQRALLHWPDFRVVELESGDAAWFDLAADPGALHPAAAPDDAAAMRRRLRELVAGWDRHAAGIGAVDRADVPLDAAARRRLRSLGY